MEKFQLQGSDTFTAAHHLETATIVEVTNIRDLYLIVRGQLHQLIDPAGAQGHAFLRF